MEVELKYAVPDERTADMIWLDDELGAMTEEGSCRASRFYGVYYDTCDHILTRNDITFRIRHEGERTAACLKWNGSGKGALHKRGELDRTIEGDIPETADPEVFGESEIGKKVIKLTEGRDLCPMMKVDVLRKSVRVDTGDSLVELSIDREKSRRAAALLLSAKWRSSCFRELKRICSKWESGFLKNTDWSRNQGANSPAVWRLSETTASRTVSRQ